jgi:hypothetical protein
MNFSISWSPRPRRTFWKGGKKATSPARWGSSADQAMTNAHAGTWAGEAAVSSESVEVAAKLEELTSPVISCRRATAPNGFRETRASIPSPRDLAAKRARDNTKRLLFLTLDGHHGTAVTPI